ncbi:nucleocapsid protein [Belerina virus]|uniref:Nucleocapsid n=1 Tax=Belerina virus TaxID=2748342 RepID=A0A7D5I2X1_9MONO|nr:nucleocapsid protein [Belerina virus]QKZ93212.1 nucleocapsid protein [Belerina virus]
MSFISDSLRAFKEFKNAPVKGGLLQTALEGVKKKVIILVPTSTDPTLRWNLTLLLMQLIWSDVAPGAVITGALLSLLTMFAEQPGHMVRALANDPDLEAQIVDVTKGKGDDIKFTSRGVDLEQQRQQYIKLVEQSVKQPGRSWPFTLAERNFPSVDTTEEFQIAISSVTLQVWILLTKAVTAPDTARDSEQRRWIKYLQQRRAKKDFQIVTAWLDIVRVRIAEDISVRRFMVEILIEVTRATGTKSRIIEMIADVGNYISEAGMAGFFLTIKYGIETKYPALALNELQGDLNTVLHLMKYYKEQGEKAPYLVLLEDSAQAKFAPGNYALLWSYAMGVGVTLDRAMNNLNYMRSYLEPTFFRLGQDMVNKLEGSVDRRVAEELGLTGDQIEALKGLAKTEMQDRGQINYKSQITGFDTNALADDEADSDDDDDDISPSAGPPRIIPRRTIEPGTRSLATAKLEELRANLARRSTQNPTIPKEEPTTSGREQEMTDLDALKNV